MQALVRFIATGLGVDDASLSLEEISAEMAGKVKIVKMNVDENQGVPAKLGIRGIPALMMFKDGKLTAQKVGAAPKSALVSWISGAL